MRGTLPRRVLLALAGLSAYVLLTVVVGEYRDSQLARIAYLLCAAGGLTVLTGLNGQISLGQGAFMAVGGYTGILLHDHAGLPLPVLLLAGTAAAAVAGAAIGLGAARLRGPYLAGATLALAVGLPSLANWDTLAGTLGGENGLTAPTPTPPGGLADAVAVGRWQAWVAGAATALLLFLLANLARSRVGRDWRAVRDDEVAAALCGLRVASVQLGAGVVSSAAAGLGGGLLALVVENLATPGAFDLSLSLSLLCAVVIGGLGSLAGAALGSALIVLLPS